ncbi:MAG: hypothetical protein GX177_02105 [Firmicutes bacterium]|jgi:hypothetical protein|nr:hypothetical protein [Bacillota bacterium]
MILVEITPTNQILAVITTNRDRVGGSAPIFYADSHEELEQISIYLARIFMAAIHDLGNGVYIIVKH